MTKTIALAAAIISMAALPALACSGMKKSQQQSSISTPAPESPVIKQIKGQS